MQKFGNGIGLAAMVILPLLIVLIIVIGVIA